MQIRSVIDDIIYVTSEIIHLNLFEQYQFMGKRFFLSLYLNILSICDQSNIYFILKNK